MKLDWGGRTAENRTQRPINSGGDVGLTEKLGKEV